MRKNITHVILTITVILFTLNSANAQCKVFTEKNCMKTFGVFTNSGQYNGAVMFEGEEASLAQTFYGGQNYKIVLCTQEVFKTLSYFELHDYKGNLLYSTENTDDNEFEFSVENTQNLKVRVVVPKTGNNEDLKENGCVSIMVGFKESDTSESAQNNTNSDLH